jgi:hypothetical protein
MFNILGHKENANQNYIEIPPCPVKIVFITNTNSNKCWKGCGGERNTSTLLMGM